MHVQQPTVGQALFFCRKKLIPFCTIYNCIIVLMLNHAAMHPSQWLSTGLHDSISDDVYSLVCALSSRSLTLFLQVVRGCGFTFCDVSSHLPFHLNTCRLEVSIRRVISPVTQPNCQALTMITFTVQWYSVHFWVLDRAWMGPELRIEGFTTCVGRGPCMQVLSGCVSLPKHGAGGEVER